MQKGRVVKKSHVMKNGHTDAMCYSRAGKISGDG
jgi:hypothetical protein